MSVRLPVSLLVASLCSGCFLFQPSTTTSPGSTAAAPETSGGSVEPTSGGSTGFSQPQAAPEAAPAPAAPRPVSVTLRNSCKQTVKVFFGDKPKFGSGRYSSMSSNSLTSATFQPGDMLWIVDDGQNGLSAVTVAEGMREIEILEGCTGMRTR